MVMISIIIPVYNQAKELILALESIKKQTYQDFEIIVIDDGSEIKVETAHYRQENKGAPAARNKGFSLSKGEYVIFWDADTVAEPEMLEKMYKALEINPQASYAYANFFFGKKRMPAQEFNETVLKKNNYICTMSLMRRKDFPGWDESLKRFQDWDLWLTMLEQGKKGTWLNEYLFKLKPGGTMSTWLPRFAYLPPFKYLPWFKKKVEEYEKARKIVLEKHGLTR